VIAVATALAGASSAEAAVLKHSDVVFMYQADRATYTEYGATVLAWGGAPNPQSRAAAEGVRFFGSVGMVTEFARYFDRFPQTYEEGLCRDVYGKPVNVPWLTDHQHKGIPYWWCCTQQPQFRQYLRERVVETVKAGADGVHLDDHLGSAGGLWLGLCFCDRCVTGFRQYLQGLTQAEREPLGIERAEQFDYRTTVREWIAADPTKKRTPPQHPWWPQWTIYQCRAAASWMQELRDLAARTAGRAVPMGANAGLLWPRHLSDYKSLDWFSAETDHHAQARRFPDQPVFAYRLAEAVGRPYAATASGGDWAYIKEHNLPGLVRGWIALSYAAGQQLMAPHRQWCYTPQKGTHWYQGPAAQFAPLYQFVRQQAGLLDDYHSFADLAVVLPHRGLVKHARRWFDIGNQLTAQNLSYRLLLGGDEIVDHPLPAADLAACPVVLAPDQAELLIEDRRMVQRLAKTRRVYERLEEALAAVQPAVRVRARTAVRAFARVKPGAAVIHLVNYNYEPARDDVGPVREIQVTVDLKALGIDGALTCKLVTPGTPLSVLNVEAGTVEVPVLGLWAILAFERAPTQ
jgi:hypothetical protein